MPIRIATRGSELARWQAEHVAAGLRAQDPSAEVELVIVRTEADRRQDIPIWEMGGKGVFVTEVQAALLDGRADLAVHSAKDLPSLPTAGLVLASVPPRGDPRDVLIGSTLDDLAPGAVIATGSVRRRAQLAWHRPDLTFRGLRGNIATRVRKLEEGAASAIVLAAVALDRLDMTETGTELLDPSVLLPQVGQGALAVECRDDAPATLRELLAALEDPHSRRRLDAERAYLAELGGDCDLPAGALATDASDGCAGEVDAPLRLEALLASLDGHVVLRTSAVGADPGALGREVAGEILGPAGGEALLDSRPRAG